MGADPIEGRKPSVELRQRPIALRRGNTLAQAEYPVPCSAENAGGGLS